ncbi:MAG TPA: radical SAM protein [Elusimicrobiota bacterium]|nr:radical SAM protein [Elusimicrobiota bacterium]
MPHALKQKKRHLLRIIIPAYPAFNIYSFLAHKTTALGPVCVATAAKEVPGWDVEVIDENNLRLFGPRDNAGGTDHALLERLRPADVVGFYGGLTSTIPRLYQLARFYKEAGAITLAGGQHFVDETLDEALSSGLDYVAIGEGEETIKEFLGALGNHGGFNRVRGLAWRDDKKIVRTPPREPLTDFDGLPLPDFSLLRYAKVKIFPVGRIRGCAMHCEFCTVKSHLRFASPERLLENYRLLVETKNARHFFIVDDLFGQQRNETIRFCRLLQDYQATINRKLNTTVQIRLDKAKNPELLTAMRHAGIHCVAIGFESPVEEELLAMNKHLRPQDMISLARTYHDFGFLVHGMFIFGYPLQEGRTLRLSVGERIRQTKDFIRKAKIDTIQVLLPVPLPGTELRARLQDRVFLRKDMGWEYYDGNFPLFEPTPPLTPEDMQLAVRKLMGKFYEFKYMFYIAMKIFLFPGLVLPWFNIKSGWARWYRNWRNYLIRFGGWITIRGWAEKIHKDNFLQKLDTARKHLGARTSQAAGPHKGPPPA